MSWTLLGILAGGAALYRVSQSNKRISQLEARIKILESAALEPTTSLVAPTPIASAIAATSNPITTASTVPISTSPLPPISIQPPETAIFATPWQAPASASSLPKRPSLTNPPQPSASSEPSAWTQATESIVALIKKNPFATLGVLLVLIGVGFLFSLMAASNFLSPLTRVLLVASAGSATFAASLKLKNARPTLAANLQGGALALQFLCALWAYQGYHLLSASAAFAVMALISILAFGWSVLQRDALFAFIGLAGSLLTPIVASTGGGDFSGLTLYVAAISLPSLSTALYLHTPSLASATLAGISLLLGSALGLPNGTQALSVVLLPALSIWYSGVGLHWSLRQPESPARQQASLIAILLGAPLIFAGFLNLKADVTPQYCTLPIAITALIYTGVMWRMTAGAMRVWLFAIGSGLGLIAIGVGLEGASRALAVAAAALGLVLLARTLDKPWANGGALLYWTLSVLLGVEQIGAGHTMPLLLSAAIGLGAGYLGRGRFSGALYTLPLPLLFGFALLHARLHQPMLPPLWLLGWAVVSSVAGRLWSWPHLRLSAAWLLPAGFTLLLAPLMLDYPLQWLWRESVLVAWLGFSTWLVWSFAHDRELPLAIDANWLGAAASIMPALASIEVFNALPQVGVGGAIQLALAAICWALWCAVARWFDQRFEHQVNFFAVIAGAVCAAFLFAQTLFTALTPIAETLKWLAVALLIATAWADRTPRVKLQTAAAYAVAGVTLLGSLLQMIGVMHGRHNGVAVLLVEPFMQPWISVFWAGAGIALVAYASATQVRKLWMLGGAAILALIAKMLLVDLATFTLLAKVVVFMATGIAFIALGYFCLLPPEEGGKLD